MLDNTPLNFLYAGVVLYTLGFGLAAFMALRGKEHDRPIFYTLIIAGFLAQSTGLYLRGLETHSLPVGNAFELVQALAWVAVFLKLILHEHTNIVSMVQNRLQKKLTCQNQK